MSDMRPAPIVCKQGDKKYRLLFTLAAVDEIQSRLNMPISTAIGNLADIKTLKVLISALAGEEIKIYPGDISAIKSLVMLAVASGMPQRDEDAEEIIEDKEAEMFPVARALYIGTTVLGFPEAEVWDMTLRKLLLLYTEHRKYTGTYRKPVTIDDVIPL